MHQVLRPNDRVLALIEASGGASQARLVFRTDTLSEQLRLWSSSAGQGVPSCVAITHLLYVQSVTELLPTLRLSKAKAVELAALQVYARYGDPGANAPSTLLVSKALDVYLPRALDWSKDSEVYAQEIVDGYANLRGVFGHSAESEAKWLATLVGALS